MVQTFKEVHKKRSPRTFFSITKYNHYHDELGRFASAPAGLAHATMRNGGSTTNMRTGKSPKSGYMVVIDSDRGRAIDLPKGSKEERRAAMRKEIEKYVSDNKDLLFNEKGGKYMGTWLDTETGKLWLDVSTNFTDKGEAMRAAAKQGEIAIWDVSAGDEIRIDYDS